MSAARSPRRAIGAVVALAVAAALVALPGGAAPSSSGAPGFSTLQRLPRWAGGEPSIAFDPDGKHVYVVAPQYIPSAVNSSLNVLGFDYANKGVGFWASADGGKTWHRNANIGSGVGGGDADVEVGPDHTVYVADLELIANAICTSSDYGQNFTSRTVYDDGCVTLPVNQQGPESDRQWINVGPKGEVYLSYHDLNGWPVIWKSTDKAQTFAPCGVGFDPAGPAVREYNPALGTLQPKPVIGKDGSIFIEISIAKQSADVYRISDLFIAVAEGGCSANTVFKNYPIFQSEEADFKLFQSLAMDGAGNLYVVAAGKLTANQKGSHVYVFTSRDRGRTWSKPVRVDPPAVRSALMPAIVGGLGAGQVAIGWYGTTTSDDPGHHKNQWRYYVASSFDYGRTFRSALVTPQVMHYGDICVLGVMCGLTPDQTVCIFTGIATDCAFERAPANRNLADFTSLGINPKTGCLAVAIPGDPYNRPDIGGPNTFGSSAYVATQTRGACLTAPKRR